MTVSSWPSEVFHGRPSRLTNGQKSSREEILMLETQIGTENREKMYERCWELFFSWLLMQKNPNLTQVTVCRSPACSKSVLKKDISTHLTVILSEGVKMFQICAISSFKVGMQDQCHQLNNQPNVTYGHNLLLCLLELQCWTATTKAFFADHDDVKPTFDISGATCRHFVLSCWDIHVKFCHFKFWGHRDLSP